MRRATSAPSSMSDIFLSTSILAINLRVDFLQCPRLETTLCSSSPLTGPATEILGCPGQRAINHPGEGCGGGDRTECCITITYSRSVLEKKEAARRAGS